METIINKYKSFLGDNDLQFVERVYATQQEIYINRLRAIGLENLDSVLDAGCGFGQWTLALAKLNNSASGTDVASHRLVIAQEIAMAKGFSNVYFKYGSLNKLPFDNEKFDAVFCYGAVMLSNPEEALKQFYRVLKKNGRLYVNVIGMGWYLHLWKNSPNKAEDYDPKERVVRAFCNTYNYQKGLLLQKDSPIMISPEEMSEKLTSEGFKILEQGGEGVINIRKDELEITPFFQEQYNGESGVYEFLAVKKS